MLTWLGIGKKFKRKV